MYSLFNPTVAGILRAGERRSVCMVERWRRRERLIRKITQVGDSVSSRFPRNFIREHYARRYKYAWRKCDWREIGEVDVRFLEDSAYDFGEELSGERDESLCVMG